MNIVVVIGGVSYCVVLLSLGSLSVLLEDHFWGGEINETKQFEGGDDNTK